MSSELEIRNNSKNLICCFGSMALKMGGIMPFEFLNFLSANYANKCDLLFYIDKNHCCYHRGFSGITKNIDDTVTYLNAKIHDGNYDKVIFMGISAGGYASILFGSLCQGVTHVIGFIPVVKLSKPINNVYANLKNYINPNVKYVIFGDKRITNVNDPHHLSQCKLLEEYKNVIIIEKYGVYLKELRDNGTIKSIIDQIIRV